jgi:transposase
MGSPGSGRDRIPIGGLSYSLGSRMVVADLSASVMIQKDFGSIPEHVSREQPEPVLQAELIFLRILRRRWIGAQAARIWLATEAADMRCGFDRLPERVRAVIGQDPLSGHLFVFRSRRGERLKILLWDRDGFLLWYKRLESGVFKLPRVEGTRSVRFLNTRQLWGKRS